jgi:hypothetical protein
MMNDNGSYNRKTGSQAMTSKQLLEPDLLPLLELFLPCRSTSLASKRLEHFSRQSHRPRPPFPTEWKPTKQRYPDLGMPLTSESLSHERHLARSRRPAFYISTAVDSFSVPLR